MTLATDALKRAQAALHDSEALVRAWTRIDMEHATRAAAELDARGDQANLPLRGLAVGVKDIFDVAGMQTVAGFAPFATRPPATVDAVVVARLRAAGAVILGKTVTTQFAVGDPPVTRNPWDTGRTPGGSSSGSAAAVAAGHVELAVGSQTTGSTLRPAAYCGVYGLKPSFNWVSRAGMFPLSHSLDHVGLLAASMSVLRAGFLAARNPSGPERPAPPLERRLRLGVWHSALHHADDSVRAAFEAVVAALAAAGADVFAAPEIVDYQRMFAAQQVIFCCEAAAVHRELFQAQPDDYAPKVRSFVEVGSVVPAHWYIRAQTLRSEIRALAMSTWRDIDAVLLPTAGSTAPTPETTGDTTLQAAATLLGLPAISVPAGLIDGLPWGLQLIAPGIGATEALLNVAQWVDERLPRSAERHPPIHAPAQHG